MNIEELVKVIGIPDEELPPGNIPRGLPTTIPLENLYFAGIPSNISIPLQVPVLSSFSGDVADVKVNRKTLFDGRYGRY